MDPVLTFVVVFGLLMFFGSALSEVYPRLTARP
jgi:hypothetical protein